VGNKVGYWMPVEAKRGYRMPGNSIKELPSAYSKLEQTKYHNPPSITLKLAKYTDWLLKKNSI
jgi:hypothetical protein